MENTNTTNQSVNTEAKSGITLTINPVEFNPIGEVAMTTTNEIAKMINDIFSKAFKDYHGCNIVVQFNQAAAQYILTPYIYFRILPKDAYENTDAMFGFKPLSVANESSVVCRVHAIAASSATSGPKVTMTDELKSVLKDYVLTNNIDKFDWSNCFTLQTTGDNTFVRAYKLDILKFLKAIFGSKDASGSDLYYQPSVIRALCTQQYGAMENWSISILRLNRMNEEFALQQQGIMVAPANVPVAVTATTR